MTLKELLRPKLSKKELEMVPSSFDIIGNKDKAVAIIEIPEKLLRKKGMIARALMKKHKNVKSVLLKGSPRKGIFRTRDMKLLAGDNNTEVVHIENGCRFLVDPKTSYFSQREGTERTRIIEKVKPDETVMVFFAGVGPFAIEIARKTKAKNVIGIEINPIAVEYFKKNIILNKVNNVEAVLGDVKQESEKYQGIADRILMPLPESSVNFIKEAVSCLKKGGVCHFYCFADETKLREIKQKLRKEAGKIKFIGIQRVLPYGPSIWKYRIDFEKVI
jgi:tRNA (guanine37-N1)-methyltransferase